MKIQLEDHEVEFDQNAPIDLSIPLNFNRPQPNAYGVAQATSKPCEAGQLVGDTRRGGSCNFEQYTLIPHCSGTHTECVGHITHERISIRECLADVFIPAVLISIEPENALRSTESYHVAFKERDLLITKASIEKVSMSKTAFAGKDARVPDALIIRTLPNDQSKLTRHYSDVIPPFFSTEAIRYIVELGFKHLLVDLPSIDRLVDEGKLSNHRTFWNIKQGSFQRNEDTRINSTITELIYVANEVEDGEYLLNLQIAPFAADASPSRPIIFETNHINVWNK